MLTNGTLAPDPAVRQALCLADVLVPSLDAVSPEVFRRVNRPAPKPASRGYNRRVEGPKPRASRGELLLEILLVAGINDTDEEIELLIQGGPRR